MKPKVIGLGAGGHAKVIIEILRELGHYELVGLLEAPPHRPGAQVLGVPILGGDERLAELFAQGIRCFFVGVGSVGDASVRQRLFANAVNQGWTPIQTVHPRAVVSPSARLGAGTCVFANAVINAQAQLEENVIVNTAAVVEHDCMLAAHVHIATGARLAGAVHVGEGSHVGIGASVRQNIRIGRHAVVGAGAVVVRDVPDGKVVVGVPARVRIPD